MKAGTSPLELCGVAHLSAPIGEAVGKVLSTCQTTFGGLHLTVVQRSVVDHLPKEKIPGLLVLRVKSAFLPGSARGKRVLQSHGHVIYPEILGCRSKLCISFSSC